MGKVISYSSKSRLDHHDYLIHFTKKTDTCSDLEVFLEIVTSKTLKCGTGKIKGKWCCICFTEAPPKLLTTDDKYFSKYSPFGLMFKKEYIFGLGGRPAIYCPEDEYELLSDALKYRYVNYELRPGYKKLDFTWEREWRLNIEKLPLTKENVKLIFPNRMALSSFLSSCHEFESIKNEIRNSFENNEFETYKSIFELDFSQHIFEDSEVEGFEIILLDD